MCASLLRRTVVGACALATVALFAFTSSADAQVGSGKLTGVVTDAQTGEPLAGVQVFVEGTGLGALTQENGRYFIINVPPGQYTVGAQLIGYSTLRKQNVLVAMEVTRQVNFELPQEAVGVEEVIVEAERVPLIETSATGSSDVMTSEDLDALPVTEIPDALSLQSGFLQVPTANTDLLSYVDSRRGLSPIRIRGGRGGETLTLLDGIPINNFVLGGAAFFPTDALVEQLDFIRGGFEPKYGNALSGVVNIKSREAGTELEGSLEYQTSGFGGALGSDYDDLRNFGQVEGFLSGPVPGTDDNLRFVVAGRQQDQADRVLEFDRDVQNPADFQRGPQGRFGSTFDLLPGWQAIGYDNSRDLFGKLSYYFSPAMKLSVAALDYDRETQPFDHAWMQSGFDLAGQCKQLYPNLTDICDRLYLDGVDPTRIEDLRRTNQENQYLLQASIDQERTLYWANWEHTTGRLAYSAAAGRFEQSRNTCVWLSGICLGGRIASTWTNASFQSSGGDKTSDHPTFGSDDIFGGEDLSSEFLRGDLEWQATDHHNIAAGVFYQQHDVSFEEGRDVGLNDIQIDFNRYTGEPWDAAFYIQDEIEYDFITVRLGFRFDWGQASGLYFADPQDPTNGTTAFDVCENPTDFGLPGNAFTFTDEATGETFSGIGACNLRPNELLSQAVDVAFQDDFKEAETRRQFSPRIGVNFPVTESSSVFFNFGRFSQNPLINNLYRNTSIGTDREGTRDALGFVQNATLNTLLGNAHLLTEATTSYEMGYLTEIGDLYAFGATLFSKDQFGLTGIRRGGVRPDGTKVFDPGATYNASTFDYNVLLNLDFQTSRGVEVSLRRRVSDYWGFDLRYSFSQVRTNAAPPDLELQKQQENDELIRREIRSEIDQPHVFNGILRFAVGNDYPDIPLGRALQNSRLSLTFRASSGFPYTPQLDEEGDQFRAERNSGTAPTRFTVNMLLSKNFQHKGLRYGFFVRVRNLLDRENCIQVYPGSGNCELGSLTEERIESRLRGLGGSAPLFGISQTFDRPQMVSPPRSINAGIQVRF